jgi:hypothetical protein
MAATAAMPLCRALARLSNFELHIQWRYVLFIHSVWVRPLWDSRFYLFKIQIPPRIISLCLWLSLRKVRKWAG